jgi:predicted amidohydrolase
MRRFRAAVVQLNSNGDVRRNLARVRELVRAAADDGAELVALPENFAWMRVPDADRPPAGPVPGPLTEELGELARACGCHLLLGGLPEASPDPVRHYNTSVLLAPDGGLLARYRKRHLFDVDLPEGQVLRESDTVAQGDEVVAVDTPLARFGLSICYDVRFPEHYRALADAGAEVLTVPAAFTIPTGRDHWHLLLRARAVENQCFVVAPGEVGHHGGNRASYGHSLIVDPWGVVLAEVAEGEGFAAADLDPERLAEVRRRLPALRHRRR